jgi:hypothetical protein
VLQYSLGGTVNLEKHDTSESRHNGTHIIIGHPIAKEFDEPEWSLACMADDPHALDVAPVQSQALEATASSKKWTDRRNRHLHQHQYHKRVTDIGGKGLHGMFCDSIAVKQLELTEGTAPA